MIRDDLFDILSSESYEKNPDFLFKLGPNTSFLSENGILHSTNSQGWRKASGKAELISKNAEHIVVVGDSCTFGLGVPFEETYGKVLEKIINERLSKKVRVHNFSAPGYTSFQCQKILEKIVPDLKPSVIVCYIGACDGAPVLEYSDKEYYALSRGNQNLFFRILKHSNAYKLLSALKVKKKISKIEDAIPSLTQDIDWFSAALPDIINELEARKIGMPGFERKERVSPQEFRHNVQSMRRIAKRHAATFIYIPNMFNHGKEVTYRQDYLIYPYLNIIKHFEKDKTENLFLDTVHPSKKGHRIVAEAIFDHLGTWGQTSLK